MKQTLKLFYNFIIAASYVIAIVGSIMLGLYLLFFYDKTPSVIVEIVALFSLGIFIIVQSIRLIKLKHK